jgi:hypothetical protein
MMNHLADLLCRRIPNDLRHRPDAVMSRAVEYLAQPMGEGVRLALHAVLAAQ